MGFVLRKNARKRFRLLLVILLESALVLSLVFPGAAFSAAKREWGDGVLVKKDAGTPWAGTQLYPDQSGNLIVIWSEESGRTFERKMYMQKISPSGNAIWDEPVLISDEKSSYYFGYMQPVESDGGLILVWADNRNKRKPDIFAQKIGKDGKKVWGDNGMAVYVGPGAQEIRSVTTDNEDGAIIVWRDDERPGLYMQRIDANGKPLWQEDGVSVNELCGIEPLGNKPYYYDDMTSWFINVAPDELGGVYLSWTDLMPDYFDHYPENGSEKRDGHIFVQRVDRSGQRAWPSNISIDVKDISYNYGMNNQAFVTDDNAIILTWSKPVGKPYIERKVGNHVESYPNPNIDCFAAKIAPDGTILWDYSQPLVSRRGDTGNIDYYEPMMPSPVGDGLIYVYHKMRYETSQEKHIGPEGKVETFESRIGIPEGTEFTRIDGNGKIAWKKTFQSVSSYPFITSDKTGGFFIAESKYNADSPYPFESTLIQRYDPDGNPLWKTSGVTAAEGTSTTFSGIIPDGKGGLYVAWRTVKPVGNEDPAMSKYYGPYPPEEMPQSDIYVQHIIDDGSGWADIGLEDWPHVYVDSLVKSEAVSGYGNASFKPDDFVTRAEFAKMAVVALGIYDDTSTVAADMKGTDVDGHWAAPHIGKAVAAGIMQGYSNGSFRPNAKITRAEAAAVVYRAKDLKLIASSQEFTDVPAGHWAFNCIDAMRKLGVIEGYGDGTFRPSQNATRAEAAKILSKARDVNS